VACNDKEKEKNAGGSPGDPANWGKVRPEFNPRHDTQFLSIGGMTAIEMNLFGFNKDVDLYYSTNVDYNEAKLEVFHVSKDARTSVGGGADVRIQGSRLLLSKSGMYECSIRTENGEITQLKGACYVRLVITLNPSQQIEVYNADQLISQRFFAMTYDQMLEGIKRGWSSNEKKLKAIDDFLASNRAARTRPALTGEQLREVIKEFSFAQEKFQAFGKLHATVYDRESLRAVIEDQFSYFDRARAYQMAGLRP